MSTRDHYSPGVPCWVDTAQPDVEAALRFYGEVFGWEFDGPGQMPGDPPGRYYVARVRGREVAGISSLPAGAPTSPEWNTYVAVQSADHAAADASAGGGSVIAPPFDAPPAGRMAVLQDPGGAVFCAWEAGARQGAQLVNEPSAWAMSRLDTADPSVAASFYGAVFGWRTETFTAGQAQVTLWRLPGYVGGEPQQPVARDVVATMMASEDDAGARWSVDFWIDDAERAAAATERLGGQVLSEPHDAGGFRSTALRDPQGAIFNVSQLLVPGSG
ncbi:MAG: VOC family protein [Solirubrobacterales bacterium]|nr:VOC family protein [Solirubrobacterales bacterium]MBV9915316.1 VOC family protein [Solirubrobacterales bacterium]